MSYSGLPRYFLATWQLAIDCWNGKEPPGIGEHRSWCPLEPAQPTDLMFVVMFDAKATPHPLWHELPHILEPDTIQAHVQAQTPGWTYATHLAAAAKDAAALPAALAVGGVTPPAPAFVWKTTSAGQVNDQLTVGPADAMFHLAKKLHKFYPHFMP